MKKNKILKTFIALILLISLQSAVISASTGVVNKDTVRVRSKASTDKDSAIIALVSIGDKVTILGEEGDWYKVKAKDQDGDQKTGYIRKDLLTVEGTVEKEPEEKAEQEVPEKPQENTDVNSEQPQSNKDVNSEQNQEPETDEQIPEEGDVVDTSSEDVKLSIEANSKTISTIKRTANLSKGKKLKLTENIKIKILPLANSSNIAELQANTEVTVLEVINSWCRVESAEGECGWVRIDQ